MKDTENIYKQSISQAEVAEHINTAYNALKSPLSVLINQLSDKEPCVFDFQQNGTKDKIIELRFSSVLSKFATSLNSL